MESNWTMEHEQALRSYVRHQEYMAAYNKRPEVREKRKAYNKERWAKIKAAAQLAKEEGLL